jgi:hypothetical protein
MRNFLTQEEYDEQERNRKFHTTPIHIGEPLTEKQWKRFVFFENVKDIFLVVLFVVGFLLMILLVTNDLTQQYGIAVPISIGVGVVFVLIASRKRT